MEQNARPQGGTRLEQLRQELERLVAQEKAAIELFPPAPAAAPTRVEPAVSVPQPMATEASAPETHLPPMEESERARLEKLVFIGGGIPGVKNLVRGWFRGDVYGLRKGQNPNSLFLKGLDSSVIDADSASEASRLRVGFAELLVTAVKATGEDLGGDFINRIADVLSAMERKKSSPGPTLNAIVLFAHKVGAFDWTINSTDEQASRIATALENIDGKSQVNKKEVVRTFLQVVEPRFKRAYQAHKMVVSSAGSTSPARMVGPAERSIALTERVVVRAPIPTPAHEPDGDVGSTASAGADSGDTQPIPTEVKNRSDEQLVSDLKAQIGALIASMLKEVRATPHGELPNPTDEQINTAINVLSPMMRMLNKGDVTRGGVESFLHAITGTKIDISSIAEIKVREIFATHIMYLFSRLQTLANKTRSPGGLSPEEQSQFDRLKALGQTMYNYVK